MADGTHIEWTDATWNIITGCSVVSPGCTNCYAMRLAGTRLQHHHSRAGLTVDSKAGPVWTGEVRFNAGWLDQPLAWTKPRRIFVCAHGDLFHPGVQDEWLDQVFAVMAVTPRHTYQVLTKRADRMRAYLSDPRTVRRVYKIVCDLTVAGDAGDAVLILPGVDPAMAPRGTPIFLDRWPLPNVWAGVSVEDQTRVDERIPDLLATPAAVRWVSAEPLLGPVDLTQLKGAPPAYVDALASRFKRVDAALPGPAIRPMCLDWVVAGGESGPGARAMHPDWARSLRDQCAAAGTAFLFKQWGDWLPGEVYKRGMFGGFVRHQDGTDNVHRGTPDVWWSGDAFGGQISSRVGKRTAGRTLDGVNHDAYPETRT